MSDYTELVKALRHCAKGGCDDCSYLEPCLKKWQENKNRFGASILMIMDDAAAAIEALQAEAGQWKAAVKGQEDGIKVLQAEVKRLEPNRGKWIVKGANRIDCSVCGHSVCFAFGLSDGSLNLYKYCPECGAKMEVQE